MSTSDQEISFRNGREELVSGNLRHGSEQSHSAPLGLTSWGEFGTLQAIILSDSARGNLRWSHWGRGKSGVQAVFEFAVPQLASHYRVDYCCVRKTEGPDLDHPYIRRDDKANRYTGTPAYHGTASIDPNSGAIQRITLQADFRKADPVSRNDVSVQFGEVKIGDRSYVCPIQSVAISSTLVGSDISSAVWEVLRINDVRFMNYHRFGSTMKVLPGFSQP